MRASVVAALVLAASVSANKLHHIGHIAEHVTNVAGAVEAVGNAHAALHSRSNDGLYERGYDDDLYARELEARNRRKLHIGHVAEHVTNVAGAVEAVGNAHAALHSRSDDGLYEREYDDELYARDFDEDLYARELADAIYARALEARNRRRRPSISHVAEHITNVAGAVEAVGNAHAALHSRSNDDLWDRSFDYYDELD